MAAFPPWGVCVGLTNSTVSGNSHAVIKGGGIYGRYGANITLTRSTVSGNRTRDEIFFVPPSGGGIFATASSVTLVDSTVADNHSLLGGGIYGEIGAPSP